MITSVVPARTNVVPDTRLDLVLARCRGRIPERPDGVDRNRSQGLRRIVGVGDAAREG
jgi:hypothetical protein